jgi:site-specific DNA recombinase
MRDPSGKDITRKGLEKLVSFLEVDHADVAVVYKTDRLTEKQRHFYQLLEDTFEKRGMGFKSMTEPFDTTTVMGKGFLGMLGVFAQLEGDLISERTKHALRRKKELDEHVGSAPLGFEAKDKTLGPKDDEPEAVK